MVFKKKDQLVDEADQFLYLEEIYLYYPSRFELFRSKHYTSKVPINKKNARKLSDDVTLSSNEEILISQNEERIKAQAKNLFLQYFGNSVSYNQSDSNTKSCLILIDFPIDIYEKAEEMFKNNYTTDNLENVFNDSLSWISAELEKLFKIYITDVDEKKKMEKILFFLDCFEI